MKYYGFIFCFFMLSITIFLRSEKLHEFQEPFKAVYLAMDEEQIYIADRDDNVIHIYSRKDFAHIGQFGGEGQGPAEFEFIGFIRIYPDFIYVSGERKISYFSKKGNLIRTATPFPNSGGYIPLGENFVCRTYPGENPKEEKAKVQVELLDSGFTNKRALYLAEFQKFVRYNFQTGKRDVLLVRDCFKLDVYNDRLYVGNTDKGFFFIVFDASGEKLYEINLPWKEHKVSSDEKKYLIDRERQGWGEQRFNQLKASQDYVFPRFYPAYSDFTVTDGKIYVFSYPIKDKPQEVFILDLQGNILRKNTIPDVQPSYFISKGICYYIKYNDDTYKWELHLTKLD